MPIRLRTFKVNVAESLKQKTISGIIWSVVQRVGTVIISFISSLVLARLLSPENFGCIGMLMVFTALADNLVDGGFDSALIQKKEPSNTDYSTVFYFNLLLSLLLYAVLFFSAPTIASFYKIKSLSKMLRVLGIITIINALGIVQNNQFRKQLHFNKIAIFNVISTTVSTIVAIILAFLGFGVWSLVAKYMINSTCRLLLFWLFSEWIPLKVFSFESLKSLFCFGGLIFLADVIETIVNKSIALFIGRYYSSEELGFYTQADNLNQVPERTIPFVINQVFFPVFSSMQDDIDKVVASLNKSLKALTFVSFPLMIVLIVTAKPLIIILFTEKWLESVGFFKLLCFGGMIYSVNSSNVIVLKALGQGKSILYISFIKRGITFASVIIGIHFGVYGIVWGSVLSLYLWFPTNAYFTYKITGFGIFKQIRAIGSNCLLAILVGCIVYFTDFMNVKNNYILCSIQIVSYFGLYLTFAYVFKNESFNLCYDIARSFIKNNKR